MERAKVDAPTDEERIRIINEIKEKLSNKKKVNKWAMTKT